MTKSADQQCRAALCLLFGMIAPSFLFGQSSAPATKEEVTLLDRFLVTGSNIPTAVGEVAVPVTTIGSAEIQRSGIHSNFLELIRKEAPIFSGNGNLGVSNGNSNASSTLGGSRIQMRNLDTLVLVNGRRIAASASAARSGVGAFYDVNLIPIEAIDRIELVADGSSAIYGSDAVGGVVNIILKSNLHGGELGSSYAFSTRDGNYTEKSAYAIGGAGNDRVNITSGFTYFKSDPLFQNQRPFSQPILGKAGNAISGLVGGAFLLNSTLRSPSDTNPTGLSATAPNMAALVANGTYLSTLTPGTALDISPYVTELLALKRKSGYATINASIIGKKLEGFAEVLVSGSDTFSQLAASGATLLVLANAPFNPTTGDVSTVGFRLVNLPRQILNKASLRDYTAGFKGEISPKWNWELSYKGSNAKETSLVTNVFYGPNLSRVAAGGFDQNGNSVLGGAYSKVRSGFSETGDWVYQPALDPFARGSQTPASLANLFGVSRGDFWSDLYTSNFTVRGEVFDLPGGTVCIAAGGDYREEKVKGIPDANSRPGGAWTPISSFNSFSSSRNVSGAFTELRVPLTSPEWNFPGFHAFEATEAYRSEHYSDAGHSEAPKLSLQWQPVDEQISLRYSHSKSFTAPALYSTAGPILQGFTAGSSIMNLFGVNGQATLRSGSNSALRPSKTTSDSWGAVFQPKAIKGLRFEVDYVDIKQRDYVSNIGSFTILQNVDQLGAASLYANRVAFNGFPGESGATAVTKPGQINEFLHTPGVAPASVFINDQNVNIGGIKVRAVDLSLSYDHTTQDWGTFDFTSRGVFFLDYQFQAVTTEPYFEYAGAATYGGSGSSGTIPGYKFYTAVNWHRKRWGITLANTYIPGVVDIGPGGNSFVTSATQRRIPVSSYSAWDFVASYEVKGRAAPKFWDVLNGLKFSFGVNNLTDKMPPEARQAFSESNADISTYSPIGRLFFLSAEKNF